MRLQGGADGMRLDAAAHAKGSQYGSEGKKKGQPFFPEPVLQYIHGAAHKMPIFVLDPPGYGEKAFPITGGNSQQACKPAPEDGSRAANSDGRRDADNISGANSGCKSGGKSGIGRDAFSFGIGSGET